MKSEQIGPSAEQKRRRRWLHCPRNSGGKSHFLLFCEETELNGLLHVPQTGSRLLRAIYVISFGIGTVAVLLLFVNILLKYMAHPKGINQEFVTHQPMPFPELNLCRYMIGLSRSQLREQNVSDDLAKALHWRLEVNYSPNFMPNHEVRQMLAATAQEYQTLKTKLGYTRFHQVIRHFLPRYDVVGHQMKAIIYQVYSATPITPSSPPCT